MASEGKKSGRFQIETDWRRFDREFAVVDSLRPGRPWVLQTNDQHRATTFAFELNAEAI